MLAVKKTFDKSNLIIKHNKKSTIKAVPRIAPESNKKLHVLPLVVLLCLFLTAFAVINRFAVISSNHKEILQLNNTLDSKHDLTRILELELSSRTNLRYIEKTAATIIGMKSPEDMNVSYVVLPDIKTLTQMDISDRSTITENRTNLISRILNFLMP